MFDDGLKYLFSLLKMLIRNAVKGEIWAIFILVSIIVICLALIFFNFLKNIFKNGISTGHSYEEVISEDDSGKAVWARPLNGERVLMILFLLVIFLVVYFSINNKV